MTNDNYDIDILKRSHKNHIKQLKMDSFTNGYETGFSDAKKDYFILGFSFGIILSFVLCFLFK